MFSTKISTRTLEVTWNDSCVNPLISIGHINPPSLLTPAITINSPNNGDVFDSRRVLFDIELNEPSSLYYTDNINGRGRWKRIGTNRQSFPYH